MVKSGYDVVIVGAGPAGCAAARGVAAPGRRVLLLDARRFPRWKPCAGAISAKGLPLVPPELRHLLETTVRGAWLTFGDGRGVHTRADMPVGRMVHRERFDAEHLKLARRAPGVKVVTGVRVRSVEQHADGVTVECGGERFAARAVVGADGVNSVVSRVLDGAGVAETAVACEVEASFEHPALTEDVVFDLRAFPGGYGWVFPKRDHYSIGGYVCDGIAPELPRQLDRFLRKLSPLVPSREIRRRGHRVPLAGAPRPVESRGVLLAGDAASLVDPLTGEGIYYALLSGQLAAEALDAFLSRGEPLVSYAREIETRVQRPLQRARTLARWLYGHPRLSWQLMHSAEACSWIVGLLAGTLGYERIKRHALDRIWRVPATWRRTRRLTPNATPASARAATGIYSP